MLMIDCKVGQRLFITLDTDAIGANSLEDLAREGPIEVIVAHTSERTVRLAVSAPAAFCLLRGPGPAHGRKT